jgi:hypothetical protein
VALARLLGRTAEERSGRREVGSDTVFETIIQEKSHEHRFDQAE